MRVRILPEGPYLCPRGVTDKHTGLLNREERVRILPGVPILLAVVTYVETVKPGGWAGFDRVVNNNLDYTFDVDRHYYVARQQKEVDDFHVLQKLGTLDIRCVRSVFDIEFNLPVRFVNVQPEIFFKRAKQPFQWLHNYLHPNDACYVLGPNHGEQPRVDGDNVAIALEESSLYSFSALAVVLYDRRTKL